MSTVDTFTEKELTKSVLEFEGPGLKVAIAKVERSDGKSADALGEYAMKSARINYLLEELWDRMSPVEREQANEAARG